MSGIRNGVGTTSGRRRRVRSSWRRFMLLEADRIPPPPMPIAMLHPYTEEQEDEVIHFLRQIDGTRQYTYAEMMFLYERGLWPADEGFPEPFPDPRVPAAEAIARWNRYWAQRAQRRRQIEH